MEVLVVVWFASAVTGVLAVLLAVIAPRLRRRALLVAGASFGVAGILGILSIGIVFVALSAICFTKANQPFCNDPAPEGTTPASSAPNSSGHGGAR